MSVKSLYDNGRLDEYLLFSPTSTLNFGDIDDPLFRRSLDVIIRNRSKCMVLLKATSTNRAKFKLPHKEVYLAVSGLGIERLEVRVHQSLVRLRKRKQSWPCSQLDGEGSSEEDDDEDDAALTFNEKTLRFLSMPRDLIHFQALFGPQTKLFGQVPEGFDEQEHWTKQFRKHGDQVYNKLLECTIRCPKQPSAKGRDRQNSR